MDGEDFRFLAPLGMTGVIQGITPEVAMDSRARGNDGWGVCGEIDQAGGLPCPVEGAEDSAVRRSRRAWRFEW